MIGLASWLFALAAATSLPTVKGLHQLQVGRQPTYIIHSRANEVVPFEPAERNAR